MLISLTDYAVTLHDPVQLNRRWQANTAGAYSTDDFAIDWEAKKVICPDNKKRVYWLERKNKRNDDLIVVLFANKDCLACEQRVRYHRSTKQARSVAFKPKEKHEELQGARR